MSISAYWSANFVYDFLLYMFIASVTVGIANVLSISALIDGTAYTATWLLFAFYGLSYIPLTYLIGFYYKDYGTAQAFYFIITFVSGGMIPLMNFFLRILGQQSGVLGRGLAWVFRLFPAYAFG